MVEFSKTVKLRGIVTADITVEHTEHAGRLDAIALTQRGIHRDGILRIIHLVRGVNLFYLRSCFQCLHKAVRHFLEFGNGTAAVVFNIQFHTVAIAIAKDGREQEYKHRTTLHLMGGCLYTVVDAEDVVAIVLTVVPVLQTSHHQAGVGALAAKDIPAGYRTCGSHIGVVLYDFRHLFHRLLCLC